MIFPKETSCLPPSSRHERRRKLAPLWLRLLKFFQQRAKRSRSIWLRCPSYKWLVKYFGVSEGAISRAFRKLEEHGCCPLKFRSGYTGKGGTREKLFSLNDNLLFDCEPLFLRKDGRSRGIRESFRRDAEPVEPETPQPD